MTTIFKLIFVFFLYLFVIAGLFIAEAHEFKVGTLDIGHPWSRPTPKDATIAGGYLTITNKGKVADRLIGGASPAASQIEVHEMANVDGMTKTRALASGLEIKPGKTVELKPGALSHPAARPQGAAADRPEGEGHAGVREGRACRDRLQRRGKSRSLECPQWRRATQASLRCAFACVAEWTMGTFTPCSNWRAPHRRRSRQPRDRSRAIRELRPRHPFGASRRTDGGNGRKEDSNERGVVAIPDGCYLDSTFFTGANDPVEPECLPPSSWAVNRHREIGGRRPQCCARRCSGSDWHFLPARCCSPH